MNIRRHLFASGGQALDERRMLWALLPFRSNAEFVCEGLSSLVVEELGESSSENGLSPLRSWLDLGQGMGALLRGCENI